MYIHRNVYIYIYIYWWILDIQLVLLNPLISLQTNNRYMIYTGDLGRARRWSCRRAIYLSISLYNIYIYIYREREREILSIDRSIYIYLGRARRWSCRRARLAGPSAPACALSCAAIHNNSVIVGPSAPACALSCAAIHNNSVIV